ncbi:phosphoenolpyruvate synthase [Synechococcus sp. PCC 6312]|uniref:phosphoenolpyruvate synthase n=1 Tax=Synechococcus sp. (strain ATCC 27167 / PCC 6312) TaxID=195253 RepID=UPI00029F3950|nr:phosphoenolpyruvate synthase [Synechococcus sp. PCC 6312]AFY60756.1 phosphoenolpyruvate synthase/pyruvate phosphate dikinase [Synechococcus sp. PCC 6312]
MFATPAQAQKFLSDPSQALVLPLNRLCLSDLPLVGGKNASLGEMLQQLTPQGINVPDGFATTAYAYRTFILEGGLEPKLRALLSALDVENVPQLRQIGQELRSLILETPFPTSLHTAITQAYGEMCQRYGPDTDVAVRSSATAEDLPDASFAGQQETYLNVHGLTGVLKACHSCFASIFTDRAISYRQIKGFDHLDVALSVGVQKMVRSDLASSGVMFSIDTETGFKDAALITAAYGLGENVVQGAVNPDEYLVFKPTLKTGYRPILEKRLGSKEIKMVYDLGGSKLTKNVSVCPEDRARFALSDDEILQLGHWACAIEDHYSQLRGSYTPMDIEWAKDGNTGELFIVQARPETVQSQKATNVLRSYKLQETGEVLVHGRAVGEMIGQGQARVIMDVRQINEFQAGEVLVTNRTDPDWEPIMKKASAIVTNQGGRTCFTGDTKILTNQGFMSLSQVYDRGSDGLLTLSFNPQTQGIEWKPIIDTMKRPNQVIGVSVSQTGKMTHNTLRLTPDHKMINLRNGEFVKTEIQEMLANQEMVVVAQTIPQLAEHSEQAADLAYFLGGIITDGSIYTTRTHGEVQFIQKDVPEKAAFITTMQAKAEKLFGKSFTPYEKKASTGMIRGETVTGQATAYRLYSKSIAYQVKELEENIVPMLLQSSPEVAYQFLAGVIDGDGCYANNRINIYASEENLLQAIIVACMKINTVPQVTQNRQIYNVQIVEKLPEILSYTQRVKGEVTARTIQTRFFAARQLFDETAMGQVKLRRDQNYLISEQLLEQMDEFESLRQGDIRMQRVVQVENLQPAEVFNITVADHHNYVVFTEKYTPVLVCNCHAAIIAREMGIPAIVGCGDATTKLQTGQAVTISCAEGEMGKVYAGLLNFLIDEVALKNLPRTRTQILMNVGNPEEAFGLAAIPNDGVGLARLEFIIANHIQAHPLALLHFEQLEDYQVKAEIAALTAQYPHKPDFFVDKLAHGIGTIAAAFYPKPVVVRMSDFKSNEYANLLGGRQFEPQEENPMIGWRGASRYYDPLYAAGFALECQAMKRVRDEMGLTNVILMIPFCRTPAEGQRVLEEMAKHGLNRGENGLEVYVMCELPSNVVLADQFSQVFDGFSIGSNDLTQLTLGLDRDSGLVAHLFDERNDAVLRMVAQAIQTAKKHQRKIGICGQAPSDYPEFAQFLVEQGIDSISLNPDSVLKTLLSIAETEAQLDNRNF